MAIGKDEVTVTIKAKDKASRVMKGVGGGMQDLSQRARKMGMAFMVMGTAIVGAMALSVKSWAKAGDEVQKMAMRTGFSTEALSELRYAMQIAGTDIQGFEKAVRRMSKAIADANDGMATYIRGFERVGLLAQDLIRLSPEEAFWEIAYAVAKMEDPILKAATALDLFGRAGTQLFPLLEEGAEGIEALRQKAHDLGIVFDQETANKAAELNDAFLTLKESTTGIKNALAEVLAPTLTEFADKLTEVVISVKEWTEANPELFKSLVMIAGALGPALLALGVLGFSVPIIATGVKILAGVFAVFAGAIVVASGPIIIITALIATLIAIGWVIQKQWFQIGPMFRRVWNEIGIVIERVTGAIKINVMRAVEFVLTLVDALKQVWKWLLALLGIGGAAPGKPRKKAVAYPYEEWIWGPPTSSRLGMEPGYPGGGVPGYARGGLVERPSLVRVAEKEPELITPLSAILPINITISGDLATLIKEVSIRQGENLSETQRMRG